MDARAQIKMFLPFCGGVGVQLCVEAVQSVLTGYQKLRLGRFGRKADVQRGGADLQHQQLTGGTNDTEIQCTLNTSSFVKNIYLKRVSL